jgi:Kelch motif protein
MIRPLLRGTFAVSVLALAACNENTAPTPAGATGDPAAAVPSFALASNSWTRKAPLPGPNSPAGGLFGVAAGVVNNSAGHPVFYALGGNDGRGPAGYPVQAYNLATNTWSAKKTIVDVFRTNGVGKIGGKLYFSGGYTYCCGSLTVFPQLWAYDVAADRLIRKADMPKATADGVTGVINGKLYVLPGNCSGDAWPDPHYCEKEPIRQFFRYDPVTNSWTTLARAPHFHANGAGGVIHGKFYVAGGNAGGIGNAYLDAYDPWSNTWKTLAPMPARRVVAVGAIQNGKLWVIGSNGSNRNTYVYDAVTNRWATKAPLPVGGATEAAAPINDSQSHILVVGGGTVEKAAPSELYTP